MKATADELQKFSHSKNQDNLHKKEVAKQQKGQARWWQCTTIASPTFIDDNSIILKSNKILALQKKTETAWIIDESLTYSRKVNKY